MGGLWGVPADSKVSLLRGLKRLRKAWCRDRGAKVAFIQWKKKGGSFLTLLVLPLVGCCCPCLLHYLAGFPSSWAVGKPEHGQKVSCFCQVATASAMGLREPANSRSKPFLGLVRRAPVLKSSSAHCPNQPRPCGQGHDAWLLRPLSIVAPVCPAPEGRSHQPGAPAATAGPEAQRSSSWDASRAAAALAPGMSEDTRSPFIVHVQQYLGLRAGRERRAVLSTGPRGRAGPPARRSEGIPGREPQGLG